MTHMKQNPRITSTISLATALLLTTVGRVRAAITNPAVGDLGNNADEAKSGQLFTEAIVRYWQVAMTIGGLIVLVLFIWGALQWITSSGDKGKLESARNRMLQAAIGLFILISSFVLVGFIGNLLFGDEFQILNLTFFTP